jgi:guanyl-specific ribonuclease Sa
MRFTPVTGPRHREGVVPVLGVLPVLAVALIATGCSSSSGTATVGASSVAASAAPSSTAVAANPATTDSRIVDRRGGNSVVDRQRAARLP